ncbi:MAG: hypothetical protein IT174_10680 [Acidobacteria bacterium]|nr:hypothetical protein [Acidobacteriota bacterium]
MTGKLPITDGIRDLLDDLTGGQKLLIGGVVLAVLIAVCFGGYAWSGWKISRLEKETAEAKVRAGRLEDLAAKKEIEAEQYKQKIEHLEGSLAEIKEIAKTQDEELEKLNFSVRGSRADVERARGIRSIRTTADELCKRLGEVGHPCE